MEKQDVKKGWRYFDTLDLLQGFQMNFIFNLLLILEKIMNIFSINNTYFCIDLHLFLEINEAWFNIMSIFSTCTKLYNKIVFVNIS